MIIKQGKDMTFANPDPYETGVTGRWNRLDTSSREAETLSSFKCALSKAILWYA